MKTKTILISLAAIGVIAYIIKKSNDKKENTSTAERLSAVGFSCPKGQQLEIVSDGKKKYFVCTNKKTGVKNLYSNVGELIW